MSKKRILFVVNPISGTGKKGDIALCIEKNLDKTQFEYAFRLTERAGHAMELAAEAAGSGVDIVAAVGGDGTVNEVARSLVHTRTALAIIPCGSGNGLARHLQIPREPAKAIRIINEATIHCLDYGKINGQPFFCTCGMGFDALVSLRFAESGKRGPLSYVENTLREGLKYKPDTYTIEDENGTVRHKAFLIACANASQYGNNAYIAPHASMKDGLMDIIVMEPFSTLEAPQIALQLFNKTLLRNNHVKTFRASKVRITRENEGVVHCDGEPCLTGKTIQVEVIRHSLHVVVNPEAHSKSENVLQSFTDYLSLWAAHQADLLKRSGQDLKRINQNLLEKLKKL